MFDSRVSDPALDEKYAPTLGIFLVPEAARNGDMVFEALITIIFSDMCLDHCYYFDGMCGCCFMYSHHKMCT